MTRDDKILNAAYQLADTLGMDHVTQSEVAQVAGIGVSSVKNYGLSLGVDADRMTSRAGAITRIRDAVMRRAVETGNLKLVAVGLTQGYEAARTAPEDLKARALAGVLLA